MFNLLSVVWDVDPVLVKIGPLALRYYSLLFVAGFPFGYWLFTKFYKREGVDTALLEPLLYALLIGTIVGSRLGHCIFYQPDYYFGSWKGFLEVFQPWKGGLASHGGAIGVLLSIIWYVRKYGKRNDFNLLWLMDRLVIAVSFAGCCIRLGNLFNSEIYGCTTDLPWGFIFVLNGETEPKHPTQIYEALSYLILGLMLLIIYFKKIDKVYRGWLSGAFFIGCFGMRFLIEFIKNDQVGFERGMAINMGQVLSIPFIVAGMLLIIFSYKNKRPSVIVHQPKNYRPAPKSSNKQGK